MLVGLFHFRTQISPEIWVKTLVLQRRFVLLRRFKDLCAILRSSGVGSHLRNEFSDLAKSACFPAFPARPVFYQNHQGF